MDASSSSSKTVGKQSPLDMSGTSTVATSASYEDTSMNSSSSNSSKERAASSDAVGASYAVTPGSLAPRPTMRKSVSFHEVGVREFARTVGDHPDVKQGPPVSMEYHHFDERCLGTVHAYEEGRGPRREILELRTHPNTRYRMLLAAGHGKDEIRQATREANRMGRQRRSTASLVDLPVITVAQEATQSIRRKMKRGSWRSGDTDVC